MYSSLGNVQVVLALLKKYNISNIVISPGTRHTPLVCSVEHDDFFHCYSVVDERSASFFALGLIEELQRPVAICCTSGTAACNYLSAVAEALYQQQPLLVITADRHPYYLFQQKEQMVPQVNMFKDFCKYEVTLPIVRDDNDFWYCSRVCNEALIELSHRDSGPVHINLPIENDYPVEQCIVKFDTEALPDIKRTELVSLESPRKIWEERARRLKNSKILIIYGQHGPLNEEEKEAIESFSRKYDCVISKDILANLHTSKAMDTFAMLRSHGTRLLLEKCPNIVITMNANTVSDIKQHLMPYKGKFEHWHVSKEGKISDPFKSLPDVIECSPHYFFTRFAELGGAELEASPFYDSWRAVYNQAIPKGNLNSEAIEYSSVYATQQFIKNIPSNSLLHVANSNSIRLACYFQPNSNINIYGNRGTNGIDGSMSSFLGQSHLSQRLSFLLIGDLSFFYDMNSLWNRYLGNNIRIMVCNNSGGAIFYTYPNKRNIPSLEVHIAAEHCNSLKGWAEDRGFKYLKASNKEELDRVLPELMVPASEHPILMEVFTDKTIDAQQIASLSQRYTSESKTFKHRIAKYMPEQMKEAIKKVIM